MDIEEKTKSRRLDIASAHLTNAVEEWLAVNGYAGLENPEPEGFWSPRHCVCELGNLCPCGRSILHEHCMPAGRRRLDRADALPFSDTRHGRRKTMSKKHAA